MSNVLPMQSQINLGLDDKLRDLLSSQRNYFATGETKPYTFRVAQLKALKKAMKAMELDLLNALASDLHKGGFESYMSEVGFLYEEINHMLKRLKKWMRPKFAHTPLIHQPSLSWIYPQPKGVILVISPWNYPIMLSLAPVIGAIAAGNCVILKPSEIASASEQALTKLLTSVFPSHYVQVVTGGVEVSSALLRQRFDHIFFTGSPAVGKIVMTAAAAQLTPVTLELGGKSPCIIDRDCDLNVVARRVAWGKFYNAGQTCISVDYVLVPRDLKARFVAALKDELQVFYGADPSQTADYGRIVSDKHFQRLSSLIDSGGKVAIGGTRDRTSRYIAPTVITDITLKDPIMQEEIFGPIMPILEYDTIDDALATMKQNPNPLACYVFTESISFQRKIIDEFQFGGGCVNNALVHLVNSHLPFGGIGSSGMGACHGKHSFDTFTHFKAMTHSPLQADVRYRYPPYRFVEPFMRWLMR